MVLPLATFAASAALGAGQALLGQTSASDGHRAHRAHGTRGATGVAGADQTGGTGGSDKAKKTADDFEAMFLEQSLDRLNAGEGTDGPLGENGAGGGVYRSMLTKEYAGQIVRSGGVGISGQVYGEILKLQGAAS